MVDDSDLIEVVAPIYKYHPVLIAALRAQTHDNWKIQLIHDGPNNRLKRDVAAIGDDRIVYWHTRKRHDDFGHTLRARGLERVSEDASAVLVTNADNLYAPSFLKTMLRTLHEHPDCVVAYCDFVSHHHGYAYRKAAVARGHIDCGCALVRREIACEVGWRSREHAADWVFFDDIREKHGQSSFVKVDRVLMLHN